MITKTVLLRDLTTIHQAGVVELNIIEKPNEVNPLLPFIGCGSNILVKNARILQRLSSRFSYIIDDGTFLIVGGATPLKKLIAYCVSHDLSCVEYLAGVPASVGGAVFMNAGAFGQEIGNFVESVKVYNFKTGEVEKHSDVEFGYRRSSINGVVLEVKLRCCQGRVGQVKSRVIDCIRKRKAIAHLTNTFGSIFKNPKGEYAGRLIEACGLKGKARGNAAISTKHANYIVSKGTVDADDVLFLIDKAKSEVFKAFGIELEEEVKVI